MGENDESEEAMLAEALRLSMEEGNSNKPSE